MSWHLVANRLTQFKCYPLLIREREFVSIDKDIRYQRGFSHEIISQNDSGVICIGMLSKDRLDVA